MLLGAVSGKKDTAPPLQVLSQWETETLTASTVSWVLARRGERVLQDPAGRADGLSSRNIGRLLRGGDNQE